MILPKHLLNEALRHAQVRLVRSSPLERKRRCRLHGGLSTGPKTAEGRAAISAANTKHGRYKNWREKQAKERYYRGEIKRVMREAKEAGLLVGKWSVDPRGLSNLFRVPKQLH